MTAPRSGLDFDGVVYLDRETELAITAARSGLAGPKVERIVDLVRDYRASGEYDQAPTLRGSIMIARVVAEQNIAFHRADPRFVQTCLDLLGARSSFKSRSKDERVQQRKMLMSLIEHHCPAGRTQDENAGKQSTPRESWREHRNRGRRCAGSKRCGVLQRREGDPVMAHVRGLHETGGIANYARGIQGQPAKLTAKLARLDHQRGLLERQLAVWTEKQQVTRHRLGLLEKQMAEIGG